MIKTEELNKFIDRYKLLEDQLNASISDKEEYIKISKEYSDLKPIIESIKEYQSIQNEISDLNELINENDEEISSIAKKELQESQEKFEISERNLKAALIPKDPLDEKNVILEIRAGTGGDEAALFAGDLFRMYQKFSENLKWKFEIISISDSDHGGIKESTIKISGQSVYSLLKYESGVHRVQRVPETESQGRVHTSAITVAVLPEAEEVDFELNLTDVKKDTFRASGAGGQHVNKTESAVRLTHLPTLTVVECQDGRSQHKNYEKALQVLRSRLYQAEAEKLDKERADKRKSLVSTGDRSAKIRTYNYPQGRITDHRINKTIYNLSNFMNGDIQDMIDALIMAENAERLNESKFDES